MLPNITCCAVWFLLFMSSHPIHFQTVDSDDDDSMTDVTEQFDRLGTQDDDFSSTATPTRGNRLGNSIRMWGSRLSRSSFAREPIVPPSSTTVSTTEPQPDGPPFDAMSITHHAHARWSRSTTFGRDYFWPSNTHCSRHHTACLYCFQFFVNCESFCTCPVSLDESCQCNSLYYKSYDSISSFSRPYSVSICGHQSVHALSISYVSVTCECLRQPQPSPFCHRTAFGPIYSAIYAVPSAFSSTLQSLSWF